MLLLNIFSVISIIEPVMRKLWWMTLVSVVVVCLAGIPSPALAISVTDYFTFSDKTEISKAQVLPGETFRVSMSAQATCIKDIPLRINACEFDGRLVAVHSVSRERIVFLSYTYLLSPFPNNKGETVETSYNLDTAFPENALAGSYDLVAELAGTQIKAFMSFNMYGMLPESKIVGTVTLLPRPAPVTSSPTTQPPGASTATASLSSVYYPSLTLPESTTTVMANNSAAVTQPPPTLLPSGSFTPPGAGTIPDGGTIIVPTAEKSFNLWLYAAIGAVAALILALLVIIRLRFRRY
jgi:hypothetical protein